MKRSLGPFLIVGGLFLGLAVLIHFEGQALDFLASHGVFTRAVRSREEWLKSGSPVYPHFQHRLPWPVVVEDGKFYYQFDLVTRDADVGSPVTIHILWDFDEARQAMNRGLKKWCDGPGRFKPAAAEFCQDPR